MSSPDTKSPCINICKLTPDGVCRGCFRTIDEIRRWSRMSDDEKASVILRVKPLMSAEEPGKPPKRARKLDKKIRKLEKRLERLRAERAELRRDVADR